MIGMTNRFVNAFRLMLIFSLYYTEVQNDMLMWLMSEAKGVERSLAGLARRMLVTSFAAIHTTSTVSHIDFLISH